jgi:hypothetical protein
MFSSLHEDVHFGRKLSKQAQDEIAVRKRKLVPAENTDTMERAALY